MPNGSFAGNDLERRIIDLLSKDIMSTSEIARRIGMRRDIAAGYLEALKDQGKLEFSKVGKAYVYTAKRLGKWVE
jgi:predicted transcriptional regulator